MTTVEAATARPQDRVITREPKRRRDWAKMGLGTYFVLFLIFLYAPMILMAILSFQGYYGGVTFPFRGPAGLDWWRSIFETQVGGVYTHAERHPALRASARSGSASPQVPSSRFFVVQPLDGVPPPVPG